MDDKEAHQLRLMLFTMCSQNLCFHATVCAFLPETSSKFRFSEVSCLSPALLSFLSYYRNRVVLLIMIVCFIGQTAFMCVCVKYGVTMVPWFRVGQERGRCFTGPSGNNLLVLGYFLTPLLCELISLVFLCLRQSFVSHLSMLMYIIYFCSAF